MIYTSMYRSVIDALDPLLESRLPGIQVEWLQSGSEKISTRLDAELEARTTSADLVMTSDPFWYERKKREGHFAPHVDVRMLSIPSALVDRSGAYASARISTMVIAYNSRLVSEADAPDSFDALFSERWAKKVTIPDPLGSGTAFTTLAFLTDVLGDQILEKMKRVHVVASGGNTAVIARLESGEQHVGFVLLENVLAARRKGSPIAFKIPKEGAIAVPGPIALLEKSNNPGAARAVYDLLLEAEAQNAIVQGDMHSPFTDLAPPTDAPALSVVLEGRFQWSPSFISEQSDTLDQLRQKFSAALGGP